MTALELPFFETRRAPLWVIAAVIALQPALAGFFELVVFRNHWTAPLFHATGGLIQGTLDANLPSLALVVGGLIFWLGRQLPQDVGWKAKNILPAAGLTVALWAIVNVAAVLYLLVTRRPLALDPSWTTPGPVVKLGSLLAQVFGNALYEETVYRGFLTVQLMLLFKRLGRLPAMLLAAVVVQAIFMAIHVPMLIVVDQHPLSGLWPDLVPIFIVGIILVAIYFLTANLFVSVGVHALIDVGMMVAGAPAFSQSESYLFLGVPLCAACLWRLARWRRSGTSQKGSTTTTTPMMSRDGASLKTRYPP